MYVIAAGKLADVYSIQKKYKDALRLFQKQVELVKPRLGESHVAYIIALKNIATQYNNLKKPKSAIKASRKLVDQLNQPDGLNVESAKFMPGVASSAACLLPFTSAMRD